MLFHRCLSAWLSWVENVKEERMLKEQHDKRAEKMATLLKAASSGQLWQDKKTEEESGCERDAHVTEDLVNIFHLLLLINPLKYEQRKFERRTAFYVRGRDVLRGNFYTLQFPGFCAAYLLQNLL